MEGWTNNKDELSALDIVTVLLFVSCVFSTNAC